ncbi:peptidase family M41-domain-containing protein [Xylariomycetidae sp. FL0641]|nr:peptidase family M41-domain-containing protein [Xylariomycetidae sp. FL0641]
MALQASALPSVAAATTELWPSIRLALRSLKPQQAPGCAPRAAAALTFATTRVPGQCNASPVPNSPAKSSTAAPFDIRSSISTMQRAALFAGNPPFRSLNALAQMSFRPLSTSTAFRFSPNPFVKLPVPQRRSFQTGGFSRNLLSHLEEAANRNPNSATTQNTFYQALLRANMPAIIVERYQTNRFATNPAATEAYHKALAMLAPSMGQSAQGDNFHDTVKNLPGNLTSTQVQAVTQALAAHSHGGNLAVAKDAGSATGGKDGPLHVVVDETIGGSIFRWVKFLLWFALFTYISLVVVTMMIEGMSVLKRPAASKMDNEAKAEQQKARFTDVHGCEEAKEELQEMVDFLRNPEKFNQLGGKLPKGILLAGPPGTGKTLLARAVAGEAGVPFFYMSGSEFDEVYVGVGAKRVRELFAAAKAKSPAIVFIDELDAIGARRNARDAVYIKQTLNQLLTELDGFDQNSGVIIIGATNFPESLDKALTRPGRFDRHVHVDLPDVRGRLAILQHHAKKVKAGRDVDLQSIALTTPGLSGAELENIVNQAAVHASKSKAMSVRKEDFDWAKDKIIMGAAKKAMVMSPKEKEMTAYHEAGHALMILLNKGTSSETLYKVTILPRGPSLGHTAYLPEMDRYSKTASNYLAQIDTSLGGKLAEELVYGISQVTSGASSDLRSATRIAYMMVASLGMSSKLGNVEYASRYEQLSSATRTMIEQEVQRTVDEAYERCRDMLTKHRKELDLLAKALVEYETLSKEEVEKVIRGEPLPNRVAVPKGPMKVPVSAKAPGPDDFPIPGSGGNQSPPSPPPPAPPGVGRAQAPETGNGERLGK